MVSVCQCIMHVRIPMNYVCMYIPGSFTCVCAVSTSTPVGIVVCCNAYTPIVTSLRMYVVFAIS